MSNKIEQKRDDNRFTPANSPRWREAPIILPKIPVTPSDLYISNRMKINIYKSDFLNLFSENKEINYNTAPKAVLWAINTLLEHLIAIKISDPQKRWFKVKILETGILANESIKDYSFIINFFKN